jgi:transketolase
MHTVKPLDREAIAGCRSRRSQCLLLTVEEHNVLGGLGGAVAEVLADLGGAPRLDAPRHHGRVQPDRAADAPLCQHYRTGCSAGIEARAPARRSRTRGQWHRDT